MDLYNKVVELIGEVPPQFEIIYLLGMVMLFILCISIILAPLIILKGRF